MPIMLAWFRSARGCRLPPSPRPPGNHMLHSMRFGRGWRSFVKVALQKILSKFPIFQQCSADQKTDSASRGQWLFRKNGDYAPFFLVRQGIWAFFTMKPRDALQNNESPATFGIRGNGPIDKPKMRCRIHGKPRPIAWNPLLFSNDVKKIWHPINFFIW